jgi:hypothetical protein
MLSELNRLTWDIKSFRRTWVYRTFHFPLLIDDVTMSIDESMNVEIFKGDKNFDDSGT